MISDHEIGPRDGIAVRGRSAHGDSMGAQCAVSVRGRSRLLAVQDHLREKKDAFRALPIGKAVVCGLGGGIGCRWEGRD
jgi:hypothetical protein